jgi:uncharacterized protein (TIGR03437 family)
MRLQSVGSAALLAILTCYAFPSTAAAAADPATVLIVVNDGAPPETGTGNKSASTWLGEYYANARGIPAANVVKLNLPMDNVGAWDNWNISWTVFDTKIRQPIKKFLTDNDKDRKILYVVMVYGVPVRVTNAAGTLEGISIDSYLAAMNSGTDALMLHNPYLAPVSGGEHIRTWTNPRGWKMYLVTRLDGPGLTVAKGLVDKAIHAEANLKTTDGIAYFDWRNLSSNDGYGIADRSFLNAYNISQAKGFKAVLNDNQSSNAKMIHDAPNTLWAWGWYSGTETWDGYKFVEGAVGAQLTSYSANNIRYPKDGTGTWVPVWLLAGITATWGATGEPYTTGYALGDNLLNHFWSGYNFAESSYLAAPYLNHMMIFIGDPLYSPKIFQPGKLAITAPGIVNVDGTSTLSPGSIAAVVGANLSNCTATNGTDKLPSSLCGTQVTFNGTVAPLFYAAPTQVNVLIPHELSAGQDAQVTVTRDDGDSAAFVLPAARLPAYSPAIFLYLLDGVVRAVVQNSDYSTNGPLNKDLKLRPLQRGEAAVLYANGLGPTDAAVSNTDPVSTKAGLIRAVNPVEVFVNGTAQHPFFAGLTPGLVGVFQVNFILDNSTQIFDNDQNAVWLNMNGVESPKVHISLQL